MPPVFSQAARLSLEQLVQRKMEFVTELRSMPIAINTAEANEQHYEVSKTQTGTSRHRYLAQPSRLAQPCQAFAHCQRGPTHPLGIARRFAHTTEGLHHSFHTLARQLDGLRSSATPCWHVCLCVCMCVQVPTEYYLLCLGKHLKYSSCLYNSRRDTLSQAEANMLGT